MYIGWIGITSLLYYFRNMIFALAVKNTGRKIFELSFNNIIRRPLSFFDTTPSGVIITRFSKDLNDVEKTMPTFLDEFLNYLVIYLTSFVLLIMISPLHGVCVAIFLAYLSSVISTVSKVITELTRMEKISIGPVISLIGEMISGYITF